MRALSKTRSGLLTVLSVMLLLAGSAFIGWAATDQRHAPQPAAAAAGTIPVAAGAAGSGPSPIDPAPVGPSGVAAPSAEATAVSPDAAAVVTPPPVGTRSPAAADAAGGNLPVAGAAPAFLPRALPTAIRVPAIDITSPLLQLGLAADGTLLAPAPGPDYDKAAWFTGSATPGEYGPAVIEGHVDSKARGPSVFFRLGALVPGDKVEVDRADGVTAEFTVDAVRSYPKNDFPTQAVYGGSGRAELRLITCGGALHERVGHYADNIIVFATLTGGQ